MNEEKAILEELAPEANDTLVTDWQLAPLNLSVPDSGKDMPDVQLEALCDIIFANLKVTKLPRR